MAKMVLTGISIENPIIENIQIGISSLPNYGMGVTDSQHKL
jgi:hypothetical protein